MSELRQDLTTREWVIIATDRARRPQEFTATDGGKKAAQLPPYSETCPFCPGNEKFTPEENFRINQVGKSGPSDWQTRVIPNKFPALSPKSELTRLPDHIFNRVNGYGYHEVVIETPFHNRPLALMEVGEIEKAIQTIRGRYEAMRADPKVRLIVVFKNHGRAAGTSLEHPHFQIVGVPIVPGGVRSRIEVAERYYDDTGNCVYCAVMEHEIKDKERIILETEYFIAFHPFASRMPFETWIMPCGHITSFGGPQPDLPSTLAPVLKQVQAKLYHGLNDPDFNLILHTAPLADEDAPYYHWHIQILPRLTLQAGFELGSGIYITTALPEETAKFMRDIPVN
jgi:UDPglucose--hexose-1-phosphate uridylyltransferase